MDTVGLNCIHVDASVEIESTGRVKLCCVSQLQMMKDDGTFLNVADDPIELAWTNPLRNEIKDALKRGERHKNCELCWNLEDAGIRSKRQRDNATPVVKKTFRSDQPIWIDLKLGNLCNIKCRTCWAGSSTKWMRETYDLYEKTKGLSYKEYAARYDQSTRTLSEGHIAWDKISEWAPGLQRIEFYGGEPMYSSHHWDFLQRIVDEGHADHISLQYNTNGTIFPERHVHMYEKFSHVGINFSIDGINKKFEYIRHLAKWDEVYSNIQKWKSIIPFVNRKNNSFLSCCLTISNYNVHSVPETYHKMIEIFGSSPGLNFVNFSSEYKISNLPENIKQKMEEHLLKSFDEIPARTVINFMNSEKSIPEFWTLFLKRMKIHDEYRKENFQETFPEYWQMISESR